MACATMTNIVQIVRYHPPIFSEDFVPIENLSRWDGVIFIGAHSKMLDNLSKQPWLHYKGLCKQQVYLRSFVEFRVPIIFLLRYIRGGGEGMNPHHSHIFTRAIKVLTWIFYSA